MRILGIDTATSFFCLGLYDNGRIYEYNLELGRKHSALVIVTIKRVLDALDWDIKDIDYFACGLGPGSFTGLRIGAAAIKGLAYSLGKPVLGVSTLDILAQNADRDGEVMPAMDAKRNLIYCSIYRRKKGALKRISPYMLLPVNNFIKKIKSDSIILGNAAALYREEILSNLRGATILDKDYWLPQADNIMLLALEKIRDKQFNDAFDFKPIYLYPKECQIRK